MMYSEKFYEAKNCIFKSHLTNVSFYECFNVEALYLLTKSSL